MAAEGVKFVKNMGSTEDSLLEWDNFYIYLICNVSFW